MDRYLWRVEKTNASGCTNRKAMESGKEGMSIGRNKIELDREKRRYSWITVVLYQNRYSIFFIFYLCHVSSVFDQCIVVVKYIVFVLE